MSERKHIAVLAGLVLSVSLIAASVTAVFLAGRCRSIHVRILGEICQQVVEKQPDAEMAVLSSLKEYKYRPDVQETESIIQNYGFERAVFLPPASVRLSAAAGFLAGAAIFLATLLFWRKKNLLRIRQLADYLEKAGAKSCIELSAGGEDEFSKLQDEIEKTVTKLHQTKDAALAAKNHFAENLYNIAHQIKTPIASMFLSLQMMYEHPSLEHLEQMRRQITHLTSLEEGLLLLSRMDAGTLPLKRQEADVFTLLTLAADNLQELSLKTDVSVEIPEAGQMFIDADMDWTMEAVMNLMKNCMEHTPPGGCVYCSYEQNPIYTQIQIWDTGTGFAKEDIPHLFERFYQGKNACSGGIGIGLALSKAIIESQNGTISACSRTGGGACFEIRMYCH